MGCSPSMLINHKHNNNNKDNGNLFADDILDPQPSDPETKEKNNHVCDYVRDSIRAVKQKVCKREEAH